MTKLPQEGTSSMLFYRLLQNIYLRYTIAMAVLILNSTYCVDLPDIRVLEASNRPPVIDKSTLLPSSPIVKIDSSCKRDFSFSQTTELDIDDVLYVRWYVDYEYVKNYQKSSVIPAPSKKSITRGGDSFTLDLRNSILPNKSRGSLHTVEVIVSDRPFMIDSTVSPVFKAIEEGGNYDYISWTVMQLEDCY